MKRYYDDDNRKGILVVVAAVAVILITSAVIYLYARWQERRAVEELDSSVLNLNKTVGKTEKLWEMVDMEVLLPAEAMRLMGEQRRAAEKIFGDLEATGEKSPALRTGELKIKKRRAAAEDIARATADYIFALESATHFRSFGLYGSGLLDDAGGHEKTAAALHKEIPTLIDNYFTGRKEIKLATAPGLAGGTKYIFFILIDALRADHVGAYGYSRQTTPFIDSLAAQGLVFDNAFSQCSATAPSVASIFTALYPNAHKMFLGADWLYEKSLIENVRKAEFTTSAISSNILITPQYHYDYGFDTFEVLLRNRAGIMFREAERRLERLRSGRTKVFMYLHLYDPHDIYLPPPPYYDKFDPGFRHRVISHSVRYVLEKRANCPFDPYTQNWDSPDLVFDCINKTGLVARVGERDIFNMAARYDGEISYADSQVKNFFEYLKRKNMLSRSLVVITADHGESIMEHNQFKHGQSLYDNEIHIPLIIWRGEKNFGGVREKQLVEQIDILPTVFGLTGIPTPDGVHGRNVLGATKNAPKQRVYEITPTYYDIPTAQYLPIMSVREKRFKLIHAPALDRTELYDLAADPRELRNVCKEQAVECARLKEDLLRWNKTTNTTPPRKIDRNVDQKRLRHLKDMGYIND